MWPGSWSATAPTTQTSDEPPGRADGKPAERVEEPQRRQQPEPAADRVREHAGEELEDDDPADRAPETDERRVARVDAGREEVRRHPGADDRAEDEPDEGERGRDDPAPVAAGGREADDRKDDPVDLFDGA